MQYSKIIYPIAALFAILMVSSCSDNITEIEVRDGKYRVNVGVESDVTVEVATRVSAGYEEFGGEQYNGWVMGVVANSNGVTDKGTATYTYSNSAGKWSSDLWLGPADYDFYSYIPYENDAASVDLVTTGTNPQLIFKSQPAFSKKDLLVSVGASNKGQTVNSGSYSAAVSQTGDNQVDFRMNHLLAKLKLQFQLPDGKYDGLRKIEITSVTLGSDVDKSRNYNITCNYIAGGTTIGYAPAAANANEKASLALAYKGTGTSILGGDAKALTLSASTPGPLVYEYEEGNGGIVYVVPDVVNQNGKKIKMTITYNVFTKDSTTDEYVETRHQVTATNSSLVVCKSGTPAVATNIEAAKVYTLTVRVIPSYLYMLADVDQSNSIVLQTP